MDGLQLRSLATAEGELQLSLVRVPVKEPGPDDVVVRVDATPINPSDIGLLFGAADMRSAKFSGSGADAKVTAPIPEAARRAMAPRAGQSLPAGNEGAGEVIQAGANAQDLLGKTVAILGGAMYAQYRTLKAAKGVKTRIYYKADGTFTGKQGTASFSGTWTLDAKNMLCLSFTPLPPGATNPTCVPGTAHKVGDTWGGGTVSLVAGIQ